MSPQVSELIELSGGEMDDNLAAKFETITRTILSNQTDALNTLTSKVEKDIGQVWRQMGIMYGQLSNSINILEKVSVLIVVGLVSSQVLYSGENIH